MSPRVAIVTGGARGIGAATVLGLTLAGVLGGAYALQDEAMTVINELPAGARRVSALVERRPAGRTTICRLTPGPLADAHEWVAFYERFWNQRLDALETLFAAKKKEAT